MFADLDTPAWLVDLDILDRNIQRMQDRANAAGVKLRPHTKTHKSPAIAQRQLKAGAVGITVAKLGEAEVMADAGISDILLAYPIVGDLKLARLKALLERVPSLLVSLDSVDVAVGYQKVAEALGRAVAVYVEIETGLSRLGTLPGEPTMRLVRALTNMTGVRVAGFMTHAGYAYAAKDFEELRQSAIAESEPMWRTAEALRAECIPIHEISVGSSPTAICIDYAVGATEMRPGTYVFNDRGLRRVGACTSDDFALTVLTTVVSRPTPDRVIVDAGSKTLTNDGFATGSFGEVNGHPEMYLERLSEEHGHMRVPMSSELRVGDRLQIVPNHVCATVAMAQELAGIRQGQLVETIRVAGHGKNR